ncbi:NADH-quinone oxidoreductase subunit K, partial [Streptomyces sp. tea 10]|nr:NADH-quinone oxidoreductase subunit K [Streptomyces sp. tea 10]
MTVNLTLLVIMGVLFSVGVYLLLERSLTRVLLGIMLLTNGANLLILHTSGTPGIAPLYDAARDPSEYSDPLPQALVLTSIVISLATTAFILSM